MPSSAGLGDDSLELIDLRLGATECTKLEETMSTSISSSNPGQRTTYSLLGQFTGTLVLAVTEEFDDATLVWCESVLIELARLNSNFGKVKTYPETSLTISRTKAVRLLK